MRIIVGLFECGCCDGNFSSIEAVEIDNEEQAVKIRELMQVRSVEHQCHPTGATEIFEIKGSITGLDVRSYLSYRVDHKNPRKKRSL